MTITSLNLVGVPWLAQLARVDTDVRRYTHGHGSRLERFRAYRLTATLARLGSEDREHDAT